MSRPDVEAVARLVRAAQARGAAEEQVRHSEIFRRRSKPPLKTTERELLSAARRCCVTLGLDPCDAVVFSQFLQACGFRWEPEADAAKSDPAEQKP